jgi:hypothetical protein
MGGCMGCHGNTQVAGTDFSFILAGQRVGQPDLSGSTPTKLETLRYAPLLLRAGPK